MSELPKKFGKKVGFTETEEGAFKDEWKRSNFYISSIDKFHNHERLRINDKNTLRVPTFTWALATKWVEIDWTPYRSAPDLVRDSVTHRCHDLEEMGGNVDSPELRLFKLQAEVGRIAGQTAQYQDSIDQVKMVMEDSWKSGNMATYRQITEKGLQLAEAMPTPWSEELRGHIESHKNLRQLRAE